MAHLTVAASEDALRRVFNATRDNFSFLEEQPLKQTINTFGQASKSADILKAEDFTFTNPRLTVAPASALMNLIYCGTRCGCLSGLTFQKHVSADGVLFRLLSAVPCAYLKNASSKGLQM